jgi:hypothetical protein
MEMMSSRHFISHSARLSLFTVIILLTGISAASAQEVDSTTTDSLQRTATSSRGERMTIVQIRAVGYTPDWRSISEGYVLSMSICRRGTTFDSSSVQWFGGTVEYGLHILLPAATDEISGLGLLPFAEGGIEMRLGGLYVEGKLGAAIVLSPFGIAVVPYLHPATGYSLRVGRRFVIQVETGVYLSSSSIVASGAPVYLGLNIMQLASR